MKYSSIESKIEYLSDIPEVITGGLLNLFGVQSVQDLPEDTKAELRNHITQLFLNNQAVSYDAYCKAYALYYLPVNLQKIWRPLLDLAITDSMEAKCNILELGAGPGSATFGLVEFYRYLAYDNPTTEFQLTITAVEREPAFIRIFQKLWEKYVRSLPVNLRISVTCVPEDAVAFLNRSTEKAYHLVVESNMLNVNEHIGSESLSDIAEGIRAVLKRHGSVIMIEPAKQRLSGYLKLIRKMLLERGLNCYSPCSCDHPECAQFCSSQLDIREISLCRELYEQGIVSKPADYHPFEYAVFRNDGLRKYDYPCTSGVLSDLLYHDGELISFRAYILAIADQDKDVFALKLCDGSMMQSQSVWLNIPKSSLVEKEINALTCGRGGLIDVKNAVVENPRRLVFCGKTRMRIYR